MLNYSYLRAEKDGDFDNDLLLIRKSGKFPVKQVDGRAAFQVETSFGIQQRKDTHQ